LKFEIAQILSPIYSKQSTISLIIPSFARRGLKGRYRHSKITLLPYHKIKNPRNTKSRGISSEHDLLKFQLLGFFFQNCIPPTIRNTEAGKAKKLRKNSPSERYKNEQKRQGKPTTRAPAPISTLMFS